MPERRHKQPADGQQAKGEEKRRVSVRGADVDEGRGEEKRGEHLLK